MAVAVAAIVFTLSCSSDKGGGDSPDPGGEETIIGKTDDGHNVIIYQEGELDNALVAFNAVSQSDSGYTVKSMAGCMIGQRL